MFAYNADLVKRSDDGIKQESVGNVFAINLGLTLLRGERHKVLLKYNVVMYVYIARAIRTGQYTNTTK